MAVNPEHGERWAGCRRARMPGLPETTVHDGEFYGASL
jgi:hypothetical protein